jgi:hypothetical protein
VEAGLHLIGRSPGGVKLCIGKILPLIFSNAGHAPQALMESAQAVRDLQRKMLTDRLGIWNRFERN